MNRRLIVLVGALALTAPQAATAASTTTGGATTAPHQPGVTAERDPDADEALGRLRADANGKLRVHRAADGVVDFVSSTDGEAMVEARGTSGPTRTATDQLTRYGEAFGLDGEKSRAVVKRTIESSTGGSIVRADQVVDGVPVFGGQVVMSLDENDGVVSVDAATTEATEVPGAVVSEAKAQRNALAVVAKSHRVSTRNLTASGQGRRLYDPAIVHTFDPRGVRPVWEFEVTNGLDIRETVLVGTGRGEIALHFNDVPSINRVVCDKAEASTSATTAAVPPCTAPVRAEGGGPSGVNDVDVAYDNLGATSDTYLALGGRDLTHIIGTGTTKKLMSTVRWCFTDAPCPYQNAFWDGTQMVFGTGYAGADDVVAHELTHGYVERTSALYMFHQSAALNESLADVVGEVVDHRYSPPGPAEDNSAWDLGEDIPGGAVRNLKDPTIHGHPDKMTSPSYKTADVFNDAGEVHANDGVGNKTAYLISQGGSFNGRTVTGIDAGDPLLAKTGRLYLEVIPRLTSGAEYADLGRVLGSTCDELVAANTAGFTAADCTSIRNAVLATELARAPIDPKAAAPEAATTCPARFHNPESGESDVSEQFFQSFGPLWQRTPGNDSPTWARTGTSSLFGWNPDPDGFGDPPSSNLISTELYVNNDRATLLHFHHAHVFEWYDATSEFPASYPDGGQVIIQSRPYGSTTWTTETGLPWVNGPTRQIDSAGGLGFGGDSHGYGSSRVDLTRLQGKYVRAVFKVIGDKTVSGIGWWVDDVETYTCASRVPSGGKIKSVRTGMNSVALSWDPPTFPGSGVASYRIVTSGGTVAKTVPASVRSTTITGLNPTRRVNFEVRSVNSYGEAGLAYNGVSIYGTKTTTSSVARVKKNRPFTFTSRVAWPDGQSIVGGMPVVLQRRPTNSSVWTNVITGTTNSRGIKAWSVRQRKATYYRVVARGVRTYFGSTSAARLVKKR
jgi:Zn-dependent metalloprotease